MASEGPPEENNALKELVRVGLKELEQQTQMRDHLDSKNGVILGFALVSVIEILGFLLLVAAEKNIFKSLGWPFIVSFGVGLIGLLGATLFSVAHLWPMLFYYPEMDFFWRIRGEGNLHRLNQRIVRRLRASAEMNSRVIERKSKLAVLAGIASVISLLAYAVTVVIIMLRLIWQT